MAKRKLTISSETLRILNPNEARMVVGGETEHSICLCPTEPCENTDDTCDDLGGEGQLTFCQPCTPSDECTLPSWCPGCTGPCLSEAC